jgi:hypothetical protein
MRTAITFALTAKTRRPTSAVARHTSRGDARLVTPNSVTPKVGNRVCAVPDPGRESLEIASREIKRTSSPTFLSGGEPGDELVQLAGRLVDHGLPLARVVDCPGRLGADPFPLVAAACGMASASSDAHSITSPACWTAARQVL